MSPDPSKPVPLEAEAVERVAEALDKAWSSPETKARAAILAADEARGMRVERRSAISHEEAALEQGEAPFYRLVSRWFPIKGPVDE